MIGHGDAIRGVAFFPHTESDLDAAALAPATRKAYAGALDRLAAWMGTWKAGRPLTDELLADYLAARYAAGAAPAVIDQVVAAVSCAAALRGEPSPVGPATVRRRRGCRRSGAGRGRGQAAGIGWREADRLADRAADEQTTRGTRDAAIIGVMSDAALRVSEAAALQVADIDFGGPSVTITRSKTDQCGRGTVHSLGPPTARAVERWLEVAGHAAGPLFRRVWATGAVGRRALAPDTIGRMIARRAAEAGITGRVTGHSLRIGAAQSLTDSGATTADLMSVGRWTSERMPAHYARLQSARRDAVARLRYGR